MDFHSAYHQGFVRVAACTLHTAVADPGANAESVLRVAGACHDDHVGIAVYPELTLSGYSLEDIVMQDTLLDSVESALDQVVAGSADLMPVLVVGAPLRFRHRIYNTAVVIHRGLVLGVVPKSYLPTYREFYERRQIAPGDDERGVIRVGNHDVPFGPDLLFAATDIPGFVLHVEICEDMFVPVPPSAEAALAGATILANLSGSPITIGRAEDRCLLARSASARCLAAYVYAAAGEGESTTDLAWDGQTMVWENGVCLAQSERFPKSERRSVADVSISTILRSRDDSESGSRSTPIGHRCATIERFVRSRTAVWTGRRATIQVSGLEQRLRAWTIRSSCSVSPRLTRAALIVAPAMDSSDAQRLMASPSGFATGERTGCGRRGAWGHFAEIDITETAKLMLPKWTIRSLAARRSTTSRSRTCRQACAPTICSGWPTSAAASCWAPATSPSWRSVGRPMAWVIRCRTTTSTAACPRR